MWSEKYDSASKPTEENINEFIDNELWQKLNDYLEENYKVLPKIVYSGCSMEKGFWKGWNIKYKKSGKSLCTVYPKEGWFVALLPIGLKELDEAEILMPACSEYTQNLFKQAVLGYNGKSLAFEIRDESILEDIKSLMEIRAKKRKEGN